MRVALLLFSLATFGCANSSHDQCGDRFLLLWPTATKEFKFQEVHLPTLKSPYEVKGSAAEVYFESRLTDSGYSGSVARPRLTHTGSGLCVPMDAGSSMALTAYAQFEQIQKFDQELGSDNQVSWPRKVGVEIHLRSADGFTHNNAHYFSRSDAIAVIPYSEDGLTLSLNPGVLGHEHFHAHFQAEVINPLNNGLELMTSVENLFYSGFGIKPVIEDTEGGDTRSIGGLNKFIIRSWNEGLADFYGSAFTGQSDFFSPSLSQLRYDRTLAGPLGTFISGNQLEAQSNTVPPIKYNMVGTSYQQGTLLARVLYRIAASGAIDQTELLKRIMQRLSKIPALVAPAFSSRVMDFEEILPILIEGIKLNADSCDAIKATVSKPILLRSFSQCGS